jgi:hypothetical protein
MQLLTNATVGDINSITDSQGEEEVYGLAGGLAPQEPSARL